MIYQKVPKMGLMIVCLMLDDILLDAELGTVEGDILGSLGDGKLVWIECH